MLTPDELKDFTERYRRIEDEIALLQEDKKSLFEEIKNRVKPAVMKEALRQVKLRQKLGDGVSELDQIVMVLEGADLSQ